VAAALGSLISCGSSGGTYEAVAARVGRTAITSGAVERWIRALAPEGVDPAPPRYEACIRQREELEPGGLPGAIKQECARERGELLRKATELLISSHWLAGAALEAGARASASDISREVGRESAGFAPGPTAAELRFVASASLAAGALKRRAIRGALPVGAAQVTAFYSSHAHQFERPETRYIDIVEQLPTPAVARRFKAEVLAGRSMSSGKLMYREIFKPSDIATASPTERAVLKDVFAARLGVPVGPEPINEYSVFEVTKIVPSVLEPLQRVAASIRHEIELRFQHEALARLIDEWRARWRPRTRCSPRYVVWQCREHPASGEPAATQFLPLTQDNR
jgi:hypothetical protein